MEDWRPTAPLRNLRLRAELLAEIRRFFAERGVLEVETPLLASATVTDLHLQSIEVAGAAVGLGIDTTLYLQTSPEMAMKRLLAAGSGPIFQITKAFRGGEAGRRHNPEFTMLEWYRPGFDHLRLMDEVDQLLAATIGARPAQRLSYRQAFDLHLSLDPHLATVSELRRCGSELLGGEVDLGEDRDGWLSLLISHAIEPHLGHQRPVVITDFPASQAALAKIRPGSPPVAERFEVYAAGLEIANGYHELTDAAEQRRRFENDLAERRRRGLPQVPSDARLLAALEHGLPASAGIALGVDRLVMLAAGASDLAEVVAFPIARA